MVHMAQDENKQSKNITPCAFYAYIQMAVNLTNSDNIFHMHDFLKFEYSYVLFVF
jgi:hypothetical protein